MSRHEVNFSQDSKALRYTPRRGLTRVEAANFVGVGTSKFDDIVKDGRMLGPIAIDSRRVWDVKALDAAFDNLSDAAEAAQVIPDTWADFSHGAKKSKSKA